MPDDLSVEPEKLRKEAKKWDELAGEMSAIRQQAANLWLGLAAFFPGGMAEVPHWSKYGDCLDQIVSRLQGGAIEFELIGITLDKIASDYEDGDTVNALSFRATEEELARATDEHVPQPTQNVGPNFFE